MTSTVYRLTNYYPNYDGRNDQVDPVTAVRPIKFQTIIPRYRLSTSETRDQGTGPAFIEVGYTGFPVRKDVERSFPSGATAARSNRLREYQGTVVDVFA